MAEVQLPYRAEYSKSGRAACKACKEKIAKDILRLAAMVQSPMFDGKVPNWYHYKCFFIKQRPSTVADIENFDSLRYDDQKNIKQKIESAGAATPTPSGSKKGKSKSKGAAGSSGGTKDFSVEVAKAGRAGCRGCEQKVLKGEVRISKMDYTSDSARQYGPMPRWHHIQCFLALRDELQWWGDAKELPGFYALPADIQDQLAEQIKKVKRKIEDVVDAAAPPAKKLKKEDEKELKKQNDAIFKFRDQLKKHLSKGQLGELLEYNFSSYDGSGIGEGNLLDRLADFMTFGMPEPCSVCKGGMLVFKSGIGYRCTGDLTEYTRCSNVEKAPKRRPFRVPQELAGEFAFLGSYKQPTFGERLFEERVPTTSTVVSNGSQQDGPKTLSLRPLAGLSFVLHGGCSGRENAVKALGGSVTKTVSKTTAAVITCTDDLAKRDKVLKKAEELGVQCVAEDFFEEVKAGGGGALLLIKKKAISDWGEDPEKRVSESKLYSSVHKSGKSSSSKGSRYTKSVPDKLKLQLKDGGAVDPDSGLSDSAHVLTYGGKLYNCVMGMVDITKGTNSYYKLQLLESDKKTSWWVFRSWGRIGTTIGGNKLESMQDKQDAIRHFHAIYEEKTSNQFGAETFQKVSGAWTLLDIDYGGDSEVQKLTVSESSSAMPMSVQELVALIFDVDNMKSQMMEFEIDLKKLPLGKLSRRQLMAAFSVLTEAQELLNQDCKTNGPKILDCSNRFYTLIPHDFGINTVPLLDNLDLIKSKIEMVESLSEIEVAYNLLKSEGGDNAEGESPIDKHYKKLNTKIEEVAFDSDEYNVLQQYITNTHAATHSHYKLKIVNAFRVERKGEAKRFKPFKKLHNHKLLWHGSRLTNFAGILSQGLRIAPPEAPVTGYMFGKGIYFADMVSKSANYCSTSSSNSTGLMLLCDVALGNMYERQGAEFVTKLKGGHHSTKGCGRTYPDPAGSTKLCNIEVPIGKPVTDSSLTRSSLLYNEYIVYDVAQVEVKYLLRLDFQYNF